MSEAQRRELMALANRLAAECTAKVQDRLPVAPETPERFRQVFGEWSWEEASAMLERTREDGSEGKTAIGLCGLLFHKGIVFDRDDSAALTLLSRGGEECDELAGKIAEEPGAYARGCVAQSNGLWAVAVKEFSKGIKEEQCILCLVQLGGLLLEAEPEDDFSKLQSMGMTWEIAQRQFVERGRRLLEKGAALGNAKAMFVLGRFLVSSRETSEGIRFLERAVALGHKGAAVLLRYLRGTSE
jgi:hypothetical protein